MRPHAARARGQRGGEQQHAEAADCDRSREEPTHKRHLNGDRRDRVDFGHSRLQRRSLDQHCADDKRKVAEAIRTQVRINLRENAHNTLLERN